MPLDWHPCQLCYPLEIELLLLLLMLLLLLFWFRVPLIEKVNASAVKVKI